MSSIQNTVHYCSVSKGKHTMYVYSGGDHEMENLAALCLEMTPPLHKWYCETIGRRTYGFLIEDGYVYFVIADEGLGNRGAILFLQNLRDEFKNVAKKGLRGSFSGMNAVGVQEQLVPVIHSLIISLENVSQSRDDWKAETPLSNCVAAPTKAPLLGEEFRIAMRELELEEQRKSTDKVKADSTTLDSSNQSGAGSSISLQKDLDSTRIRSSSQSVGKNWWRQVRIVLLIDAAVCLILFVIWLSICGGIACIR